jgi:adenylyl- and sulfurtransferase ThiI
VAISYHSQEACCKFFVPPATKEFTAESAEIAEKEKKINHRPTQTDTDKNIDHRA